MRQAMFGLTMALLLLACLSDPGLASKTAVTTSEMALIVSPDGTGSRLLVDFSLPSLPEGHEVYYADVKFHVAGLKSLEEMGLFELETKWSAGTVTWTEPWGSVGGDFRSESVGHWITDDRTGDLVKFVVTESVSRFMAGVTANNGFLIFTTGEDPQQLTLPDDAPVLTIYTGPSRSTRR
jgi:hypothetical protein